MEPPKLIFNCSSREIIDEFTGKGEKVNPNFCFQGYFTGESVETGDVLYLTNMV